MLVIGLCGAEGAGKSTVARYLSNYHEGRIIPFAGPLKKMLEALGVPAESLYGTPEDKERPLDLLGGKSARWAMQSLGTEWGRKLIDNDLWTNAWKQKVVSSTTPVIIADDLRFTNEANAIHSLGGVVVRVRRVQIETSNLVVHPSQRWWELPAKFELHNDGDIDALEAQAEQMMKRLSHPTVDA